MAYCLGVLISGNALKFLGRVGDSSISGAGNFADNRYGADTSSRADELAIRLTTAWIVVDDLK